MQTYADDVMEEMREPVKELHEGPENESEAHYKSQFAYLHKATNFSTQEGRRRRYLELLRSRRSSTVDNMRKLKDILSAEFDEYFELDVIDNKAQVPTDEPMETESPNKEKKKGFRKKLMLSEWLMERPQNFEHNWLVKLCPEGKRQMVIASHCATKAYNKGGMFVEQFPSALPGGNSSFSPTTFTVLDCIFSIRSQCYFVIDILAWNGISLRQGDVECRYFWVQSKVDENATELQTVKRFVNHYPFYKIETHSTHLLRELLSRPYRINDDPNISLDGILFYHKEVPYLMRVTPLVGWLKPYMVEEILGISVNDCFKPPVNYTTMVDYLTQSKAAKKREREKQRL